MMTPIPFTHPSADGIHTLVGRAYLPETDAPRGIFHIVHGMTEHIARYDRIMQDIAAAGWIACGYDNLGHGHTARDASELGFIAHKNGWDLLCQDVKGFSDAVRRTYGEDLPYVLMGHSMGSFIARLAAERYVRPERLIIMGTGGPNPIGGPGLVIIRAVKCLRGERYISPFLDKLAFGGYNDRFAEDMDSYAWLSSDVRVRDLYRADPFCTFKFTTGAMADLVTLTQKANRRAWAKSLPAGLPVLLLSGENDPVGDYGRGVLTVRDRLAAAGHPTVCCLYRDGRHEILNDVTYPQVLGDILAYLEGI